MKFLCFFKVFFVGLIFLICSVFFISYQRGFGTFYPITQFRELVKVFLSEGRHAPQKIASNFALINSYLKLALYPIFYRSEEVNVIPLLDYKIKFFNYSDMQQLFSEIFIKNTYFFSTTNIKPFIIDCGSNIGISILYFKKLYPAAEIIAFEPSVNCFDVLCDNIENNGINDVYAHKSAVSNQDGVCNFVDTSSGNGALNASILPDGNQNTLGQTGYGTAKVETVRLSRFINRPVDFVKIDIEGAESLVLEELDQANKLQFINEMVIEYHHHIPKTKGDSLASFLAILEKNNFGYQIRDGGIRHPFGKRTSQGIIIYVYAKNTDIE